MSSNDDITGKPSSDGRRKFLKTGLGTAAGAYAIGSGLGSFAPAILAKEPIGNYPVKGDTVTLGFAVPLTGAYSAEGKDQLRAYKLAVEHLNSGGGMIGTMNPTSLKGNGVLGKEVKYVTGDSQTNPEAARAVARRMIERDGVIMFEGGSSSGVAIAQQYLAQDQGVIFMCGLTHANATTGKDRNRYGFRHYFNCYTSGQILAPVLAEDYGTDRKAFHLSADYVWGHSQYESISKATEAQGWTTAGNIYTALGSTDYSQYLTAFLNSGADVLVLNEYGNDMVNSLTQAVRFGIKKLERNGKQVRIVVPLMSRLMAQGAGAAIEGVYATANWAYELQDEGSQAFVKSFIEKYGSPPSQSAQTGYVQTLMYADAVERVGSFYPPDVIKALEDVSKTGIGPGETIYRACDHQAYHDVLVVQGKGPEEREDEYDYFKVIRQVSMQDIQWACDFFPGELGPYIP